MTGHCSIWQLSQQLQTYPDLIAGICIQFGVPIVRGPRGRMVADGDVAFITDRVQSHRSRPKLSYLAARARWTKPALKRFQFA
jgi:hypothetical protein